MKALIRYCFSLATLFSATRLLLDSTRLTDINCG